MINTTREPVHAVFPILTDNEVTPDVAICCLIVQEALYAGMADTGEVWYDLLVNKQGVDETRNEIVAMAVQIDEAHDLFKKHFGDKYPRLMEQAWGAFETEFVPEMVSKFIKNPKCDISKYCIELGEAILNKTNHTTHVLVGVK